MKISKINLEVSDDFPIQSYEKILDNMHIHKDVIPEKIPKKWSEFAGAWISVAYKFIALAQNDENYTISIRNYGGSNPSEAEGYNQESALFNFFVIGDALLESLFYSLYIIASIKNPTAFLITEDQIKRVYPTILQKKFNENYKNEPITKYLNEILASDKYKDLHKIRNILIHRTMPARTKNLSNDKNIPDTWMIYKNRPTDDQLTASFRIWLSQEVLKMMDLMNDFIVK